MAVEVDVDSLGDGGGSYAKETCIIPDGFQLCRLVSYIEMGHHVPVFNGKKQLYDHPSSRAGEVKDPEMMLHLVFEFTNAEYTGDFPLTLKTSTPFGTNGDLMNKLSISKGLEEGWCSKQVAMKQNYVKTLLAMQAATNTKHPSIASYVGTVFGVTVTHTIGKKADEDGNIPTYANMKTTSLVAPSFKNPITKEVIKLDLGDPIGTYCDIFDWNYPTIDSWEKVPKYLKEYIQKAEDYEGSPLHILLTGMQESPEDVDGGNTPNDYEAPASADLPNDDIPV